LATYDVFRAKILHTYEFPQHVLCLKASDFYGWLCLVVVTTKHC